MVATLNTGNPPHTPENMGKTFATVTFMPEGHYVTIFSFKANVWVRLLNRYVKLQDAIKAIDHYGWEHWNMQGAPQARIEHRPTARPNDGKHFFRSL